MVLLRRLNNRSHKSEPTRCSAKVGRAVRSVVQVTRAANNAEVCNGYTTWLAFGNYGILTSRDPEQQEKAVKFLDLTAPSVVFFTAIDMTVCLRQTDAEGLAVLPEDLTVISTQRRANILRFGDYDHTDSLHIPPGATDTGLGLRQAA
ncbi:Tn3 family transposase [Streptomyces lavendulae]|uniref:Tn3 family transposase n=1 Tax=Streptomyces lavendulae TaxID=1914 RepID=UPI0033F9C561